MKAALLSALMCLLTAGPGLAQNWQKASPATHELRPNRVQHQKNPRSRPNIVLILGDDMGVDLVRAYGEGASPPCTPVVDSLAAGGLLFRNAWTNPVCSPTRAAILTGRYGFRTGIGTALAPTDDGLGLDELTLPEILRNYDTTCVGKWHLAGAQDDLHPNASGFGHFAGGLGGGLADYDQWSKTVDGVSSQSTIYATTDTANEAISAINTMQEPWFLHANFNAPHSPVHVPPNSLCPAPYCADATCDGLAGNASIPDRVKAMVEALDIELGRFLAELDRVDPDAWVIFMGDNGTAGQASQAPFSSTHAKGSVYEGGVNVPFIVRGPGVSIGETDALVCSTDLYATIAEIAGYDGQAEDSVSMVPIFSSPELSPRTALYSEIFSPNGFGTLTRHDRAMFDGRYKLIRKLGVADEFYDLSVDPFETNNLIPGLTLPQRVARRALNDGLVELGVD